jgi:hypothetical protein
MIRETEIGGEVPTNGAVETIAFSKSAAAKGSRAKKTDNIETFVYRNDDGELCIPGEYHHSRREVSARPSFAA